MNQRSEVRSQRSEFRKERLKLWDQTIDLVRTPGANATWLASAVLSDL
jgi:hypothetical protein